MTENMCRTIRSSMGRRVTQHTIFTSSKSSTEAGKKSTTDNHSYNYGQFLTIWDRIGGSYRKPDAEWFNKQTKTSESTWQSSVKEMERIQKTVEEEDDRTYSGVSKKNI